MFGLLWSLHWRCGTVWKRVTHQHLHWKQSSNTNICFTTVRHTFAHDSQTHSVRLSLELLLCDEKVRGGTQYQILVLYWVLCTRIHRPTKYFWLQTVRHDCSIVIVHMPPGLCISSLKEGRYIQRCHSNFQLKYQYFDLQIEESKLNTIKICIKFYFKFRYFVEALVWRKGPRNYLKYQSSGLELTVEIYFGQTGKKYYYRKLYLDLGNVSLYKDVREY